MNNPKPKKIVGGEIHGPIQRPAKAGKPASHRKPQKTNLSGGKPPNPSMVWPQRVTEFPRYLAKELPVFHVLAYDLFFVTLIGVLAVVTNWVNWVFLIYGIFALILRAESQRMFSSALISLCIIPVATVANRTELADTFAVMAFFFLLIGLIIAVKELKRSPK